MLECQQRRAGSKNRVFEQVSQHNHRNFTVSTRSLLEVICLCSVFSVACRDSSSAAEHQESVPTAREVLVPSSVPTPGVPAASQPAPADLVPNTLDGNTLGDFLIDVQRLTFVRIEWDALGVGSEPRNKRFTSTVRNAKTIERVLATLAMGATFSAPLPTLTCSGTYQIVFEGHAGKELGSLLYCSESPEQLSAGVSLFHPANTRSRAAHNAGLLEVSDKDGLAKLVIEHSNNATLYSISGVGCIAPRCRSDRSGKLRSPEHN